MNFKEIIGPDELDWKVVQLDWKKIGKDELKLGTPMSRDGVEANDASCYGILMDDVQKDKHFQARVIVSGCVDFAKAEEYSGIKISAEAKKAIGKVWSQGGGGLTELPEGYPYKEKAFEDIVWDGSTDGRASFGPDGMKYYKVGEAVSVDNLIGGTLHRLTVPTGAVYTIALTERNVAEVTTGVINIADYAVSALAPISLGEGMDIPEAGLYFAEGTAEYAVALYAPETIHTMAPEFMPLLTSPNGTKYKLTVADDGTLSAVALS